MLYLNNNMAKKKCLIIVNCISGNSAKINRKALIKKFGTDSKVTFRFIKNAKDSWSAEGYHRLVVCGGDGTLNNALNTINGQHIEFYYLPCGTLNEYSKTNRRKGHCILCDAGLINDKIFSYVAATGSFTPLGYIVSERNKKRFKIFAYLAKVFGEYRVHNINAKINYNDIVVEGKFSLIMALDSARCFGFRFNKMHKPDDGLLHLLLIKSPGEDSFINRLKMFFPFFRAFFIGFKKPYQSKYLTFAPIKSANIELFKEQVFCIDGEQVIENGNVNISIKDLDSQINILK